MTNHTIPIPLLDTSQPSPLGKWRIASCALVLTLGQMTCFAQNGSEVPAQPASAAQAAPTDVAKELDAMKKRIEQLESQLAADKEKDKDKDKQTAAAPAATETPQTTASVNTAQPAPAPQAAVATQVATPVATQREP